jgi:hypothetical protein
VFYYVAADSFSAMDNAIGDRASVLSQHPMLLPLSYGGEAIAFVPLALAYPALKHSGNAQLGRYRSGAELNELAHAVL